MPAQPSVQPAPTATPAPEAKPKRARREGPSPEVQFLVSIRDALVAGVPVDTIVPILNFAEHAEGAAAWRMIASTVDSLTAKAAKS